MKKEQLDLVKDEKGSTKNRKRLTKEEYEELIRTGQYYKLSKCVWKGGK